MAVSRQTELWPDRQTELWPDRQTELWPDRQTEFRLNRQIELWPQDRQTETAASSPRSAYYSCMP